MFLLRRAATAILATILLASGVVAPLTRAQPSADAVIDTELTQPTAANWVNVGGNLTNERYSTLDQIATWNVANLKPAFMIHLVGGAAGKKYWSKYNQEATPVVQNGVMYITTGNDDIFALNAATGARLWTYHSSIDQKNTTVCCRWNNRGVALGQGLIFTAQLDGGIIAVDQVTGERIWKDHLVNWQDGYGVTAAPLYYHGVVYIGTVGGEFGTRGRLYALDAATGRELWRFYTVPGPHDLGGDSWPNNGFAYTHGGAPIWNTPAIDPQLGLLYFSTGNAAPDLYGGARPGANLFSASILALHMDGTLAWYFQEVHHDIWDFDAPSPTVLFDITLHGKLRHGIGQVGKTGWVYLLDRTNGKPLIGINEKPVPQYAPQATAATQPYPVGDAVMPQCAQHIPGFHLACIFTPVSNIDTVFAPLFNGGVDESPMAFSAQTGYMYTGADVQPFDVSYAPQPFKRAQFWLGFGVSNTLVGAVNSGTFTAIDTRTNKIAWQAKLKYLDGSGAGAMATAGGLVFNGQIDGLFKAYDARTGKVLWQWQTGYPDNAPAMTYDINGVQYVAIDAGGAGYLNAAAAPGEALWVFSLKGPANGQAISPLPAPKTPPTVDQIQGKPVKTNKLEMIDYGFKPAGYKGLVFGATIVTVPVGTKVTWVNTGTQPHTATSKTGGWDTGIVPPGGSASIVMNKVGTFSYYCIPHPWMTGEVIVTAK